MPIKVTCSNCGGTLHAPDDSAGKRGRCPSCGTVLTISADAPKAGGASRPDFAMPAANEGPTKPVPFPNAASPRPNPSFDVPAAPPPPYKMKDEPPRPTAPPARSPVGMQSSSPAVPPPAKFPPAPPPRPDPFMRTGRSAAAAGGAWTSVRRGLGWVQTGLFFVFLAVVACPILETLVRFNVPVPNNTPGYLGKDGLSSLHEIRTAAILAPFALGLICLIVGRFGVGSAPPESAARGPAKAAGWATLIVFLALAGVGVITGLAVKEGFIPFLGRAVKAEPKEPPAGDAAPDKFKPQEPAAAGTGGNFQRRVEDTISSALLPSNDPSGQGQRLGLTAVVAFGLAAELWFLASLGRLAGLVQNKRAAGRVNRFLIWGGFLGIVAAVGSVAFDLYGDGLWSQTIRPQWDGLTPGVQSAVVAGTVSFVAFVMLVLYWRMLGALKQAIRESFEPAAV